MSVQTSTERKPGPSQAKGHKGLWLIVGGIAGILLLIVLGWAMLHGPLVPSATRTVQKSGGPPAPDFSVPTLNGGTFRLSDHRGKPVVIFFMAYWCGTCVPEARALAQLHQKFGDRVTIVALDVDPSSTPERLQGFRAWVGEPDYIWAFDEENRVARAYKVRSLDSTVIINQTGEIVYSDAYPTSYQTLEEQIKKLLG